MSTALSAIRVTPAGVFDIIQATASALNATVSGTVSVSANNLSVRIQDGAGILLQSGASDPVNTDRALVVRNIPSGSQAVTLGVVDVKQTTASALNATVLGAVEVRQLAPSALRGNMEVYQANASAVQVTAEVRQATASALNVQTVGELAHDGVDAGNPIKFGGKALEASPTNVGANDRVNAYFDKAGRLFTRTAGQSQDTWTATCAPGNGNIRATATRTNTASGTRLVCTGFTVTMVGGSGAPAASNVNVQLVCGASLWLTTLGIPATAGATAGVNRTGLWIKGEQASGMSLEFLSAGGTNVIEAVSFEGTTVVE
jgi:hypothetical protein